MPPETPYRDATEFLEYWYGQGSPLSGRQATDVVAARAALDESPQLVQRVKRQLKCLLGTERFGAWARQVRPFDEEAEAREWTVKVIRGLTAGSRIRNTTGRVECNAPFDLPPLDGRRRHGWRDRRNQPPRPED